MDQPLPLSLFDFELPPERIAQEPVTPRHSSRLMVLPRADGAVGHSHFSELPSFLGAGDVLVVNRTRVIPARIRALKPTGGKVELLFLRPSAGAIGEARAWEVMAKPGKALVVGRRLIGPEGQRLEVLERTGGRAVVRADGPILQLLERHGEMPLPPYVQREPGGHLSDRSNYQTMFARDPGAVAAPTAALHFTDKVEEGLREAGVTIVGLTLHVGAGTFLPVRPEHAEDVRSHAMHGEWYDVPSDCQEAVRAAKQEGRRVIGVGTTSVRALETWWKGGSHTGESQMFIYPGFEFGVVSGMVTNFHLPKSTLIMLVSALAGRERVLAAYHEAIALGYRFYSYGDAMLIL